MAIQGLDSSELDDSPGLPRANNRVFIVAALVLVFVLGTLFFACEDRASKSQARALKYQAPAETAWYTGRGSLAQPTATQTPAAVKVEDLVVSSQPTPEPKLGLKVLRFFTPKFLSDAPELRAEVEEGSRNGQGENSRAQSGPTLVSSRPEFYLREDIHKPISKYEIKAGSIIPAILDSGINSDLPGVITAHVSRDVYDSATGRHVLIPAGTKLFGRYDSNVNYAQERLVVVWDRLIFSDGKSLSLEEMLGSDAQGASGFSDQVDNHYGRLYGSAILLSFITAGIQLSQPDDDNFFDNSDSVGETLGGALGTNLGNLSTELVRKNLNIKPTIRIRPGYRFSIIVSKDMVMKRV